ncbi:hypothetical protein H072_1561 [Dactylellina haptotyla CBS 200.50]|uniref:Ricin B lectin domain-containing protein n=1 Tax=Dactylellina haptotyla (strain CBS 200.50) TaxID=1284197 RepID=S8C9W3_DACHA|nr:hypothetical protein H072_1561 [Dactylellina haptotyla CBS 200.50]
MGLDDGKSYKFFNVKGGTAIDLSGTDNESITGWESHDGDNQKWVLEEAGDQWRIRNLATGRYLVPAEPFENINDGTPVIGSDDPFDWDIKEQDDDVYRIYVPGFDRPINLDLSDYGNSNDGTRVELWGQWKGENQLWRLEEVDS